MINIFTPDATSTRTCRRPIGTRPFRGAHARARGSRDARPHWPGRAHQLTVPASESTMPCSSRCSRTSGSSTSNRSRSLRSRPSKMDGSSSFRTTGPLSTYDGCARSRIGASAASFGGTSHTRPGTTPTGRCTSRTARRMPRARNTASIPRRTAPGRGRARYVVPVRALALLDSGLARRSDARWQFKTYLPYLGARHRLRHHLLLGGADDHDGAQVSPAKCRFRRCTLTASSAITTARRCRSRRATSSTPSTSSTASLWTPLLAKRTTGLMHAADEAGQSRKRRASDFPQGIPAFGTDALRLHVRRPRHARAAICASTWPRSRVTATSATSCGTPPATC